MPAFHRSSLLSPSGTSLFLFGCTNSITLDSCCQIEFVTWYMGAAMRPGFRGFSPPLAGWFKGFRGEGGRPFGLKGLCPAGKGLCSLHSKKGQRRIALAPPLGGEGHEVAQGCTTLQVENDTLPHTDRQRAACFSIKYFLKFLLSYTSSVDSRQRIADTLNTSQTSPLCPRSPLFLSMPGTGGCGPSGERGSRPG